MELSVSGARFYMHPYIHVGFCHSPRDPWLELGESNPLNNQNYRRNPAYVVSHVRRQLLLDPWGLPRLTIHLRCRILPTKVAEPEQCACQPGLALSACLHCIFVWPVLQYTPAVYK